MASPVSELPGPPYLADRLNTISVRHIRNSAIVSREVAGETIVVPICKGVGDLDSVYTFNTVGRSIWHLLENGRSAKELANWIVEHYEVDAEQAFADVQIYLAELQDVGLIRVV
jgi:hypothetical protein